MRLYCLAGLVALAVSAIAHSPVPALPGGESLFSSDAFPDLRLVGHGSLGRSETIEVQDLPFSQAIRVTIDGKPQSVHDLQIMVSTRGSVRQGDVLWLSLWARGSSGAETGEASATAHLQRKGRDYRKIASLPFSAGSNWAQYTAAVKASAALSEGEHQFTIHLGTVPQTIEIGGVTLINYRDALTTSDLPRAPLRWAGSEPDAPWRAIAAERIEALRKAPIEVTVRDGKGQPVADALVRVRQKRHHFGFGSAVAADALFAETEHRDRYRETIRKLFNKVVLENDLKWPQWERNRSKALNALAWLRENGIDRVRGHTLVWPGWRWLPSDVPSLAGNPDKLRARVLEHIADILGGTEGQLVEWDVINEPYTNTDLQKILGDDVLAEWFREARRLDPSAVLYINDFGILSAGGNDIAHQNHYFHTIRNLLEQRAPVEGIGMQGHFGSQLTPPVKLWSILDRFAAFDKPIQITEFDIDIDDEEAQAAYTRDFMTAIFAHPSIDGFMMWGFWEGRHWRPRGAMFRRDWSEKPNARVYRELVFDQWWTDVSGRTGADGVLRVRGFKGDYEIEATADQRSTTTAATAGQDGVSVMLTLQ